jgi:hypothetical protein
MKVKDEFIADPYRAWTAIGVSELITAGALVEIRAIARRDLDPKRGIASTQRSGRSKA